MKTQIYSLHGKMIDDLSSLCTPPRGAITQTKYSTTTSKRITVATMQFTALLLEQYQQSGNKQITITLQSFQPPKGHEKDTKKRITKTLKDLYDTDIQTDNGHYRIIDKLTIGNEFWEVCLADSFIDLMKKTCYLPLYLPIALLRLNDKQATAWTLGYNISKVGHIRAKTTIVLKVKDLLPLVNLPLHDHVKTMQSSWQQKIKVPFEKALKLLQDKGVITWEYINHTKKIAAGATPIVYKIKTSKFDTTYKQWLNEKIKFTIKGVVFHDGTKKQIAAKT